MFNLQEVRLITGLSIDGNNVQNDDGKVFFEGESVTEAEIWLKGYVKGNLDGIREAMDKFGVEVVKDS